MWGGGLNQLQGPGQIQTWTEILKHLQVTGPLACALHGWINTKVDLISCEVGPYQIMYMKAASLADSMRESHKSSMPGQCMGPFTTWMYPYDPSASFQCTLPSLHAMQPVSSSYYPAQLSQAQDCWHADLQSQAEPTHSCLAAT